MFAFSTHKLSNNVFPDPGKEPGAGPNDEPNADDDGQPPTKKSSADDPARIRVRGFERGLQVEELIIVVTQLRNIETVVQLMIFYQLVRSSNIVVRVGN